MARLKRSGDDRWRVRIEEREVHEAEPHGSPSPTTGQRISYVEVIEP